MAAPGSTGGSAPKKTPYFSNGQVLETYANFSPFPSLPNTQLTIPRPPLTVRLSRSIDSVYNVLGLYFTSLFALDPYGAAEASRFNIRARPNARQERPRWGGGGSARLGGNNGGGTGGGGGGSSGRPRTMGIDDVREPECGSCS